MRARTLVAALGLATIALAFFFAHERGDDGPIFRDFESYYAGGVTWRYGGDPYSREVWRTERTVPGVHVTRDELLPFVGPPFGLPLWSTLGRLTWTQASYAWGALLVASLAILIVAGVALGGVTRASPLARLRVIAALVFAAGFGPVTSGIALGQVAIVACAALALAPFALRGQRSIAKSLVASLVAALQPNVAIALVARISNARSAIAIVGAALVCAAGSALALARYGGLAHYANVLAEHAAAERAIAIQTTVGAVARGFGATPAIAAAVAIVFVLGTLGTLTYQCLSRRYNSDDRLLLASIALPLAWPFAHEHDFAIVFVPALVVAARARGLAWIVGVVAATIVGSDWLGLAQRPGGVAFETLRTCGAGLALAAFAPGARFQLRALAPTLVAVGVVAAGTLAATHPLAVWPAGLPPDFHVPLAFDAAQTWGAEQVRSGVARFDATNAFLRALSLLGCALLWGAASVALRAEVRTQPATERATPPRPGPATRSFPVAP